MKILLTVICTLITLIVGTVVLVMLNHRKSLALQNPTGTWRASSEGSSVLLRFDGGPQGGEYEQLVQSKQGILKEGGLWSSNLNRLRLIMTSTDGGDQTGLGQDIGYTISYLGPMSIKIDGPERPNVLYHKMPKDAAFAPASEGSCDQVIPIRVPD